MRESGQKINTVRVRITGSLNPDGEGCGTHVLSPKPFPVSPAASSGKADVTSVDSFVHL